MDTSETYIKMCDCPEIQGKWQYQRGDWYAWSEGLKWFACPDTADDFIGFEGSCGKTWLPRQDQLQEMVGGMCSIDLMADYLDATYDLGFEPESMEQLWLALVMREKYNKDWNGKEWVCAERTS